MDKILVVDDESGILQLCKRVLASDELEVHVASSGEQGLQQLNQMHFDMVLTDLKMPGIGGIELLKQVKKLNPQTAVVLITGQATVESAVEALKNGAYDYLLKPFDLDELRSAVQKCLEHNRLRRQRNVLSETLYLYEFSQELNKERSEQELIDFILQRAMITLGADAGSVLLSTPLSDMMCVVSDSGMKEIGRENCMDEHISKWVARHRQPLLIQGGDYQQPEFKDFQLKTGIRSCIVAPLVNQQQLIGVICLSRLAEKSSARFAAHDLESLQVFALHSALILTSLRHKLAQRQLDELKSEFVSNVSHEVRTPLMAISGAVELLMSYDGLNLQDAKIKMFMDLIARNTERMRLLVNDLLDFSRLEKGAIKMCFARTNLRKVIQEVIEDLRLKAEEKKLQLQGEFPEQDLEVIADQEKMKQVVMNLLSNAVKFTSEGGWIRAGYRSDSSGNTIITVADSGVGIPKDKQERIFDKFFQVDGSPSREKNGFGLGLAIVKSIVESHKGKVEVASEEGKGAVFTVIIPPVTQDN